MAFVKHIFTPRYIRSSNCIECGKEFNEGDECYTRFCRGRRTRRLVGHICKRCYDLKFITVRNS